MSTMLIAQNCTRESGSFMGDQLCALKTAYLFVENQPDVTEVIMSVSPSNEMGFLWQKFIDKYNIKLIEDDFHPGDWPTRWSNWDSWKRSREIKGHKFDHYRELYLRIHGIPRQHALCGFERGLGRHNIYEYWFYGQENLPETCVGSDWFDDSLVYHPNRVEDRDVYISPHCKTQGNLTFTFEFWSQVVRKLLDSGITVTVGYDGYFCEDLNGHPLYHKHWGSHREWMNQLCKHKIVACGNTGTGWLAAACGVPLITMEPPNSQMPDHRYRECGLKNIVEVLDTPDSDYCARRIIEEVRRVVVLTTGCYDVIHAGHIRHLERSKSLGTRLIVAMNSDSSVKRLKGETRPINNQEQRKTVLEALKCVDEVRIFDEDNALELIKKIKPNIITNGFGYKQSQIVGRELVEEWGGSAIITFNEDAENQPSTTKIIHKILRSGDIIEICRIGASYSVNPFNKLKLLAEEYLKVRSLHGEIADLGAYKGGTSLILRKLAPDKGLHIFDTWSGNPFDDELCHHKKGEWASSLEECRKIVGTDKLTTYYPGIFPESIPDYTKEYDFSFVYADMDTYQSTRAAIEFFWPRMVFGGKIIFDDFGWHPCAGVEKAIREFFTEDQLQIIQNQYTCVVTKK